MNAKRFTLTAFLATAALGALTLPGFADQGPEHTIGPQRQGEAFIFLLKNADTDKNGQITKDEMDAWRAATFAAIDANGDGVITPGEFSDYRKAKRQAFRDAHPQPGPSISDGTDKATADAAPSAEGTPPPPAANQQAVPPPPPSGMMARRSAGPDGMPPPGAHMPHRMMMADGDERGYPQRGWHHGDMGGFGPGSMHPMAPDDPGMMRDHHGAMMGHIFFARADVDRSGQVSKDEFMALGDAMFARLDTNGDLVITVDDLPDRPWH
ncbi:hypothetical protein FJU08_12555 [Martelella alba]|uniref:EF-hand domain-containing protein n=1 Tax=Martelella alba TaxID=2590451 RepID=A0A506U6W3_9HYPH|nr:hypothetical protein [Martelella alba]TPW30142.1 hypothetical protein FJU08_12555 [Martelella alba]